MRNGVLCCLCELSQQKKKRRWVHFRSTYLPLQILFPRFYLYKRFVLTVKLENDERIIQFHHLLEKYTATTLFSLIIHLINALLQSFRVSTSSIPLLWNSQRNMHCYYFSDPSHKAPFCCHIQKRNPYVYAAVIHPQFFFSFPGGVAKETRF